MAALLVAADSATLRAQQAPQVSPASELDQVPLPEPAASALPLPEDRGAADLEQTLKRLGTTASVLVIVPHPDDEDGALMTYLSRGLGARVTLLTLTRGEGGQNAMSAESYDALGLIRTNELLKADEYYGARQLWGTEADFGFSKTQEESFAKWGHERVLYDAVLAVRTVRPQVIVSTFVGGVSDGHGQHQVSGEIAQEAFKVAGDPKVFPEQLRVKDGACSRGSRWRSIRARRLRPSPTGKCSTTRRESGRRRTSTITSPASGSRAVAGRRHDSGGHVGPGAGPHLRADRARGVGRAEVAVWRREPCAERAGLRELSPVGRRAFGRGRTTAARAMRASFNNPKVNIDTSIAGLARLAGSEPPAWLTRWVCAKSRPA